MVETGSGTVVGSTESGNKDAATTGVVTSPTIGVPVGTGKRVVLPLRRR